MTSPGMIDAAGLVKAVKPLEFEHGAADAAGGVYEVASYGKYWAVYLNQNLVAESKSEEAAYAAAQADYAQRIASALNPSLLTHRAEIPAPHAEPVAWRWKMRDWPEGHWRLELSDPTGSYTAPMMVEPLYALPAPHADEGVTLKSKSLPCPTCGGSGSVEEPNPFFDYNDEESTEEEFHQVACHHCAGEGQQSAVECPYCGSDDVFVERSELASCYVMCNQCAARGPDSTQEGDNEDTPGGHAAILAWNRRPARSARTCSSPTHGLTT